MKSVFVISASFQGLSQESKMVLDTIEETLSLVRELLVAAQPAKLERIVISPREIP